MRDKFDENRVDRDARSVSTLAVSAGQQVRQEAEVASAVAGAILLQKQQIEQIVHDLINPLTVVKAVAQTTIRNLERARPLEITRLLADMKVVDEAVTRAVDEIDRFMAAARAANRASPLEVIFVDFMPLIERAVQDCRRVTQEHVLLVFTEHDSLIGPGDSGLLLHAIDNVLRNAMKYSPNGGMITVSIKDEVIDGARSMAIEIRDEGIGIPAAALPQIFDRFYRAENVSEIAGTGLGLSGALRIVQAHGGDMTVDSVEGQGCTVTIRLPLSHLA